MVHIYCGNGKGKTTAAMGLCLRAAGRGMKVLVCQFLKDGDSGERAALVHIPNVTLMDCPKRVRFSVHMDDSERDQTRLYISSRLHEVDRLADSLDMVFFDEIIYAVKAGLADEDQLISVIKAHPEVEFVLTGQDPGENLLALADYVSEIKKVKHPYDRSISARVGIEK